MTSGAQAVRARSAPVPALSPNPGYRATSVFEVDPLRDSRWEALVDSHPQSSVFHSTKWLKALQTTYGYDPVVATTCAPGTALTNGLAFCGVRSWLTGRRFVSLPFADHCEPLVGNPTELDDLLLHMKPHVDSGTWKYLEIRPITCRPGSQTGFVANCAYSFHRLDLRKSTQELFHTFHKDCVQRKIRRAEREKLHYEAGNSETLLQKFYELLMVTRRRQCLPAQPLSWFRGLIAAFGEDLKIRVASQNDLPIASILTLTHKKSMVYKYGCSDARFHRLGGVGFLFWKAIQDAHDKGCEEFELGRSVNNNPGLIAFKDHWGTACTQITYWTYPHRDSSNLGKQQTAILRRLVPFTPTVALKVAGRLLYRHAG